MKSPRFLARLLAETSGAAALEFALVGPAMMAMLLGVLQIGLALQNYNALRNVSAEVARYAMVQYSTGNLLTDNQLESYTVSVGVGVPYLLSSQRMIVDVQNAATQRVAGATEKTLSIQYQIPTLLDAMGLQGPEVTYNRPIFLTTPT